MNISYNFKINSFLFFNKNFILEIYRKIIFIFRIILGFAIIYN